MISHPSVDLYRFYISQITQIDIMLFEYYFLVGMTPNYERAL
jgi:hypothetical protein